MHKLMEATGESVQLYQLTENTRTCIASKEPESGLHNFVPVGAQLPLTSGSAARIIAAFNDISVPNASYTQQHLTAARENGLSESIEEREAGLSSVSAPVIDSSGNFIAALSISGSAERFRPSPAKKFGKQLTAAAQELGARI